MKLLTFSTLFPNEVRPQHGIFVETSLRHLVATGHVNAKVIAPVPWFPFKHHKFGRYSTYARVPYVEDRSGIAVLHPRYPLPPKIGMSIAPLVLANAAKLTIGRLLDEGFDFDVIDAHYFYPDGAAAILLGRYFDKPVVITALGSDINILPRYRLPRRWIKWAAEKASGIIAVSDALKHELIKLSVNEDHIKMLRNGVDLELFHPCDRENYRAEYGLRQFTLLSVGNLIPLKGHDLVIKAMTGLPDARLLIAGEGPERRNLEKLTQQLGVQDRVTFLGSIPQAILRNYYVSADVLVLASSHEGWANVLLESMACGTPVIATSVGGNPEVIQTRDAGIVIKDRSSDGILEGIRMLRAGNLDRAATRKYAEKFSWKTTTDMQIQLFQGIAGKHFANTYTRSSLKMPA